MRQLCTSVSASFVKKMRVQNADGKQGNEAEGSDASNRGKWRRGYGIEPS